MFTLYMLIKVLNFTSLIPLLVYPFVLLANVMSLAGEKLATTFKLYNTSRYSFIVVTTLYPISVIVGWKFNELERITLALIPLYHLLLCVALFYIWSNLGKIYNNQFNTK